MTFVRLSKEEARERVERIVDRYRLQAPSFRQASSKFNEAETRSQYLDPLLRALGWDLGNDAGLASSRMEVVLERSETEGDSVIGRPDYRLRLDGLDVMPVEAKRPSLPIRTHAKAAVQARRYGWSLSLPASVLSNFDELVVFDARVEPIEGDAADVAVIPGGRFTFEEYISRFDDLWRLLSYESLAGEGLEGIYEYERPPRGESPFDARFLQTFRGWRTLLAQDVATQNPSLGPVEVGRRVQRILNALLFLRICEDRNISRYEDLLRSANASRVVEAFRAADRAFNAKLFTVLDQTAMTDETLARVIRGMYWPRSQFAFGVLEPAILAGVYEQYLAEQIVLDEDRKVQIEQKPEVSQAGGVVSTPDYIVNEIGSATLDPLLEGGVSEDLSILDLAVGSGIFLLDAFERVTSTAEITYGTLGLEQRASLLTSHLFGIDIDGAAVEVARLSLLLAVLGNDHLDLTTARDALPDLSRNIVWGNSVVREDFDAIQSGIASDMDRRARVNPLDVSREFGSKYPKDGFTAIVGNPPYVRIQVLAEHLPDQLAYLQDSRSGYLSPRANNFDLYQVFIERALSLLNPWGRLGYIIPHRFTNLLSASPVRAGLSNRIERLVYFGEEQVFPGRTTYVALVIAGPKSTAPVTLEIVDDLAAWREDRTATISVTPRAKLSGEPWPVATAEQTDLFDQLESRAVAKLGDPDWVHIFVGVQTSADDYYFIQPDPSSAGDIVTFTDCTGVPSKIERSLLRPAILDQRIGFFDGQPAPDRYAIFPYRSEGKYARDRLIGFDEMQRDYPHALAYFERHRDKLRCGRKVSPDPGEAFWAYGRSQSITELDDPKLIVRVLSLTPQYALDEEGLVVPGGGDGGPYYLLRPRPSSRYSIDVIQAILSHPVVDLYVAVNGKKYRGSYASHRKAFLESVPIPMLSKEEQVTIEEHVRQLRDLSVSMRSEHGDDLLRRSIRDRRMFLADQVESILSAAYGLDPKLVARVTGAGE